MAEWLRRWPAISMTDIVGKPLGSARVSSNLILVALFFGLHNQARSVLLLTGSESPFM